MLPAMSAEPLSVCLLLTVMLMKRTSTCRKFKIAELNKRISSRSYQDRSRLHVS
ncbi:hypothetical protein ALCH109712_00645 [Alkalicoccus chagannorensis]